MNLELQIILALILDSIAGDPRWLPHPVRLIGWLALKSEKFCRHIIAHEKSAGTVAVIIVLAVTGLTAWTVLRLANSLYPRFGEVVSVLILYTCFAARDLIVHSTNVYKALQSDDLPKARKMVAMIVGRDTAGLDRGDVVRACVESVAENTVDGVIAPLFWAIIGGPLGAILYKAVNTLDSTFGYKNEQYLHFGWFAARLDDLANWLPSRISGLMVTAVAFLPGFSGLGAWRIFRRDRLRHASPNAGHSEAAVAGALGLQLGGVSYYFGKSVSKPTIGDNVNPPDTVHIVRTNRLLIAATLFAAMIMLGGRVLMISLLS